MRIRKNGKFSSANDQVHPHLCLLNQSPWDAIPFSDSGSNSDFQTFLLQLERDTSRFDGNANSNIVRSPVEREESVAVDKEVDAGDYTDQRIIRLEKDESELKGDGVRRRSQRRAAKKARSLNSNRKEFYYYAEFGPLRR